MNWLSLLVPISYLTILLGSLYVFSTLYRARKARAAASLAPYLPPHTQRDIYLSLLHLPDSSPDVKVPDSVLRAALLSRAVEDIQRLVELRTRKGPLQTLLQKGIVGDEIWQRLLRAEQELEVELRDVVDEANALSGGTWGAVIFQSASEMAQNLLLKRRLDAIKATVPEEKKAWDGTRERSRRELEAEDGGGGRAAAAKIETSTGTGVIAAPPPTEKTAKAAASSDEDGVMVEPPVDGTVTGSPGSGGGGRNKKKKGKKRDN